MNAVDAAVGLGLLRRLCGFKGYPRKEGEGRFVEVLCEVSLSVEHCSAIIESFDGEFPTLREIRDTAFNLRLRFQEVEDQRAKWKAEYGEPDPTWPQRVAESFKRRSQIPAQEAAITTAPRVPKDSVSPERRAELQSMIDHAVKELRGERARAELGAE
jgi:hypothetical protein